MACTKRLLAACLLSLLAALCASARADQAPVLSVSDIAAGFVVGDSGKEQYRIRGGVANHGQTPLHHVRLRAQLLGVDGTVIETIESVRLGRSRYSSFRLKSSPDKRRRSEQHLFTALAPGRQVRFEFFFNRVPERAVTVAVSILYSPNLFPTPTFEHAVHIMPLDSRLDMHGTPAGQPLRKDGCIRHILRLGMTVSEADEALAGSGFPPYAKTGMQPAIGTVAIATYEVGGALKLHFHQGRLFSYRSALPPSSDRKARRTVLTDLAEDFQGVIVAASGAGYASGKESNSDEFFGTGPDGAKVETQGDWLLVYDEAVLKEVQRIEYQGR